MSRPLRILANIPRFDYGKPELGNSFEFDTFYRFFKEAGFDTDIFDYASVVKRNGHHGLQKQLKEALSTKSYDLLFSVPLTDELSPRVLAAINANKGKTLSVAWMCDDKWRWQSFSQYLATKFDAVITTDQDAISKYQKIGYPNAILSQWAHNPKVYTQKKMSQKYEVVFIGGISAWREYVISHLKNQGIAVTCFGAGWKTGRLEISEVVKIYNQSKIVLNLSNSTKFELPYLFHWNAWENKGNVKASIAQVFPGLTELFLSKKRQEDIKARFFEVTGCGAFLLSYEVKHLSRYLTAGTDFETYHSLNELSTKIAFYLAHEDKRQAIADHGYQTTHTKHTYEQRFKDIFNKLGLQ